MIPEIRKRVFVRAPLKGAADIQIFGHRDPRGPDNNIYVWVDERDQLHIRILKAYRCYQFQQIRKERDWIEIIAD